ncbi:MAG: glycerate dehydrogenase [Candidatus Azotimanducaceae bacterium]|jgi:glycerate dehydrogenase
MKGVILDANSLGEIDLTPIVSSLDNWDVYGTTKPEDVALRITHADVVLSNKVFLSERVLCSAENLKLISIMATGVNNVDLHATKKLNIKVCNAIAYATPSVAQHTINLMLSLSTNLLEYLLDTRAGMWQKSDVFCRLDRPIIEMSGKKLGIIGYGELGKSVAKIARAFGMEILLSREMPLPLLLASVDYLSLHCPLTEDNAYMINKQTLALMKPSAFLINTARGGLVNSTDLIEALEKGIINGAAIDVLEIEPAAENEVLLAANHLKNLLITPHNAWGAVESRNRLVVQMRENIDAFLAGEPIRLVM